MATTIKTSLEHFLKLAKRGRHPAASGGEKRCARMAAALIEDVNGVDSEALDGMAEFIRIVHHDYHAARSLLGLD